LQLLPHACRDLAEARRVGHHRVADASKGLDVRGDGAFGVHQRTPLLDEFTVPDANDAHLGDPVVRRAAARRLQIDEY
jgi:hypothetical protein